MNNLPTYAPWIVCRKPNPAPRLRLFCFPYAGGGASVFRAWAHELPADIEVCAIQLPGRETRLREQPFMRLEPMVQQLGDVLAPHLTRPFALFGYSLGALVSFELARMLRRRQAPGPIQLFVGARAAPQLPRTEPVLHQLPDAELVAEVCRRYDGIPQAVRQEPDLMKLLLPVLRADLAVMETYAHTADEPLTCPLSVFGGLDDRTIPRDKLEAWRDQTRGTFTLQLLPGNHFFLNTARPLLLHAVSQSLLTNL
jgi:surfactin synthase thioesterase subunit